MRKSDKSRLSRLEEAAARKERRAHNELLRLANEYRESLPGKEQSDLIEACLAVVEDREMTEEQEKAAQSYADYLGIEVYQ